MKLSVIVPVFNKEKYLAGFLKQVAAQTFREFECILIDDGSEDLSGKICDEAAGKDPRIKVFHQRNMGVSAARNEGIRRSAGRYITFADCDDELAPDYLEHLMGCMEKHAPDLVISGVEKFWDHTERREKMLTGHPEGICSLRDILADFGEVQKRTGIYGYCVAKLFSRELIRGICFDENMHLAEDFDFYLKVYRRTKTIYIDNYCGYYYRQNASGSALLAADDQIDYIAQLKLNLRCRDFLAENGAFTGTNRSVTERRIADYVFFSLFHCPGNLLDCRVRELQNICRNEHLAKSGILFQDWLTGNLEKRRYGIVKGSIRGYRMLKKIAGRS
jgi:glycosyltransferase involved in cell wall biosynthesis